jgi:fructose-1,6-bisphosphatase
VDDEDQIKMQAWHEALADLCAPEGDAEDVRAIFDSIQRAVARISASNVLNSRTAYSKTSTQNAFGDVQLQGDLQAEQIIVEELSRCPSVGVWSSDEAPEDKELRAVLGGV